MDTHENITQIEEIVCAKANYRRRIQEERKTDNHDSD
jgi:hypothetical protein